MDSPARCNSKSQKSCVSVDDCGETNKEGVTMRVKSLGENSGAFPLRLHRECRGGNGSGLVVWPKGLDPSPTVHHELDRAMAIADWILKFPSIRLHHLQGLSSDHKPQALSSDHKPLCVVHSTWDMCLEGDAMGKVLKKAIDYQTQLKLWDKNTFGNIHIELARKRKQLLKAEDKEDINVDFEPPDVHISNKDFILAAKFLTKRTLKAEAVARTFSPLWKSQNDFHIKDAGNNILLFVFESDVDTKRVLVNEPQSFDKRLVLLQRYEDNTPIRDIIFSSTVLSVQLHDLPVKMMDAPTTIAIGETRGTVIESHDVSSMFGEDFMCIRICIDTTQPLCRGRKVNLCQGKIGWISFKYEKLPNFCYWCGSLFHDDKDCEKWSSNRCLLPIDSQEYDAGLQAPQFYSGKKNLYQGQRISSYNERQGPPSPHCHFTAKGSDSSLSRCS
ncbi:hypothetical protein SO802_001294 [Lithocarpus litseifolius]|uniref:Uncharacterized protein n=1 Tax=Lithocarpus litseifolius TaxID=425828 RepID=A0AAW2DXX9_9ROSI